MRASSVHPASPGRRGFTLMELLVVVAIIGALLAVVMPAFHMLQGAGDFGRDARQMKDLLDIARTYAKSRNTYVYVGIAEVADVEAPPGGQAQSGYGRVVVAIMASKDGTNNADTDNLSLVRKIEVFDRLHLAQAFPQGSGNMLRPDTDTHNFPGESALFSSGSFSAGLGAALYHFEGSNSSGVIPFNPQGIPLLSGQAVQWIEIDLQPQRGETAPPPPADVNQGIHAAVVIDGSTGATRLYRP